MTAFSVANGTAPSTFSPFTNIVGRRLRADARGEPLVLLDPACALAGADRLLEPAEVEAELAGDPLVGVGRELPLRGEEPVVHLPELALLAGGLGGLRRGERVRVERERLVLPDDPHLVAVRALRLVERRADAGAERALEVGEDDDRHRRARVAAHRVVRADVDRADLRRRGGGAAAGTPARPRRARRRGSPCRAGRRSRGRALAGEEPGPPSSAPPRRRRGAARTAARRRPGGS